MKKPTFLKIACMLFAFCATTAIASPAQFLTTLHTFAGYPFDGAAPQSPVTIASDGNIYGTTSGGGAGCAPYGCGTVFKMTRDGTLTTLYNFCVVVNCTDGTQPYGPLVQAPDGNFYGTTNSGGTGADNAGTIFKITPGGILTTLYNFCSQPHCFDGRYPNGILLAADGNFYGTTNSGGYAYCADGCGTIFKITPDGTLSTIFRFCAQGDCPNGYTPGGMIQAADGNFYGITGHGGASGDRCDGSGCGTFFKLSSNGTLTTLYSFCTQMGCPDGEFPNGQLVQARDGNFYGTASEGGIATCFPNGCGTAFKITPSGTLTILHSFCSQDNCADGRDPLTPPVQYVDGNLYGTTFTGGANYNGTIYKITPTGALTTLYSFCPAYGCVDGSAPDAPLVVGGDGILYGTTTQGGTGNSGTVFRVAIPRACSTCRHTE